MKKFRVKIIRPGILFDDSVKQDVEADTFKLDSSGVTFFINGEPFMGIRVSPDWPLQVEEVRR